MDRDRDRDKVKLPKKYFESKRRNVDQDLIEVQSLCKLEKIQIRSSIK